MTAFSLKILALVSMVADHLGKVFLPQFFLLQGFGRLSFPLFAFLIANGARHTTDTQAYLKRLVIFALISQLPYFWFLQVWEPTLVRLNIFFTLSLGLALILWWQKTKSSWLRGGGVVLEAILAQILHFDYGAAGVLLILAFYYCYQDFKRRVWLPIVVMVLAPVITNPNLFLNFQNLIHALSGNGMLVGLLALIPIGHYSGEEGKKFKYWFYWFYPAHLFLIYLVRWFF